MPFINARAASAFAIATVATLGLGACATNNIDEQFAAVNTRLDQIDARVQTATQRADAAAQSAQSANQAALAGAAEGQRANQRLDQMEQRIIQIEQAPARTPRG